MTRKESMPEKFERTESEMPEQEPLIPKIQAEIGTTIQREIDEAGGLHQYVISIINRLESENPAINNYTAQTMSKIIKDPGIRTEAMGVVYLVYRMIEHQLQAERLKKQLGE
jgi:hypothetical protein